MWFIYLLSWLSLVIQISFVTLAIGKFRIFGVVRRLACYLANKTSLPPVSSLICLANDNLQSF